MSKELIKRLLDNRVTGFNLTVAACEAADRIEELERDLLNLVCRIHRDGGHYIAKYGEAKAIADADLVAAQNNADLDALKADNARLRGVIFSSIVEGTSNSFEAQEALSATQAQSLDALLDPYKTRIAQLEAENSTLSTDFSSLRAKVFTSGDRRITLKDRTFTVEGDGLIFDNNFDFDACLRVSGDFVDDEKQQYTQMIADALNTVGCGDEG